jgi:hypothetical protein
LVTVKETKVVTEDKVVHPKVRRSVPLLRRHLHKRHL